MTLHLVASPAPRTRPTLQVWEPAPLPPTPAQQPLPGAELGAVSVPQAGLSEEAERAAHAVARALAEALAGQRPLAQLRPFLAPRVWMLLEHLVRGGAAGGMRLIRVRPQSPRDGVVEASARLASAERSCALAFRLERRARRWAVTVLEAGLAPDGRWPARS